MINKLYRVQKQYRSNIVKSNNAKFRFCRGDDVIVISGSHKGHISKIKRRYGNNFYLLESKKNLNSNLECKLKESKTINEINIKVHESNIMHYDTVSKTKSKVKYYYLKGEKNKKIRVRVYKASGTKKRLYIPKSDNNTETNNNNSQDNIDSNNINSNNSENITKEDVEITSCQKDNNEDN